MSQYYIGNMVFGKSDLSHAFRGERDWDKHKYLRKERTAGGGVRYIYKEDGAANTRRPLTNAERSKRNQQIIANQRAETERRRYGNAVTASNHYKNYWNHYVPHSEQERINQINDPYLNPERKISDGSTPEDPGRAATGWERARARGLRGIGDTAKDVGNAVSKRATDAANTASDWFERQSVKAEAALNRMYDKAYADVVDSNAYKTATKTVSAGKNWVQNKIRQLTNTATDIYKLGSGQYVKEAYEAMNRNPSSETRAAFQAAQQRYNNSIFGKVRNMIQRIVSAVKRGAKKAKSAAKNAVNSVRGAYSNFRNRTAKKKPATGYSNDSYAIE